MDKKIVIGIIVGFIVLFCCCLSSSASFGLYYKSSYVSKNLTLYRNKMYYSNIDLNTYRYLYYSNETPVSLTFNDGKETTFYVFVESTTDKVYLVNLKEKPKITNITPQKLWETPEVIYYGNLRDKNNKDIPINTAITIAKTDEVWYRRGNNHVNISSTINKTFNNFSLLQ